MNTAEGVLVIIVSITLSIFLLVGIILLVQMIRLVRRLQEIAQRAEKVIDSAEAASRVFRKVSGPAGLINFFRVVLETVSEHKHKGER
jgi:hypothetical protein